MRVAVLNERGVLVGTRQKRKPTKNDVDAGDLPADGKYFWDGKTFVPVGFGNGKPRRPQVDRDRAVYHLITALLDGRPIPHECRLWAEWYKKHGGI